MASYPLYNSYTNQIQYNNPYSYSAHYTPSYGIVTDGSYYYAVDGANSNGSKRGTGLRIVLGMLKVGARIALAAAGLGDPTV